MKTVMSNLRYWVAGVALAAAGLAVVRLIGPTLTGHTRVAAVLGGELVALTGLLVICFGVSQRIRREETGGPTS